MSSRSNSPLKKLAVWLVVLLAFGHAAAITAVIHPFESQDVLLGVAVADEVANSLGDRATVLGPDVAAGAIPPLIAEGGFISLSRVVGAEQFRGEAGADLLRSGTGADLAVTGSIELRDDGYTLQLAVAHPAGLRTAVLNAPTDNPGRLATLAGALIDKVIDGELPGAPAADGRPYQAPPLTGGFEDAYGGYVRAVALVGAGLLDDALLELTAMEGAAGAPARAGELRQDIETVVQGATADDEEQTDLAPERQIRRALLAVSAGQVDAVTAAELFAAMKESTGLPLADAWRGALFASVNDRAGAEAALAEAAAGFPYGQVINVSFLSSRGSTSDLVGLEELVAEPQRAGSAALLGISVVAEVEEDTALQEAALLALSRSSPFLTYPLEFLSYRYFDDNDALAAAEVLTVATELAPESSLYWTNLGWARYLLGAYELSEEASIRALELDGSQSVAAYNLGLVRAGHGRLEEAMEAYQVALRLDPTVNDEAVEDLENARGLFPGVAAVDYALGVLYEAEGRRSDARSAFRRYLRLAPDDAPAQFTERAGERLAALEAPLPPLEVTDGLALSLGQRGPSATDFHPGDPLYPTFELTTPGDQLPTNVTVTAELWPAAATPGSEADEEQAEPLASASSEIEIPGGAVGYVVDVVELELPSDLAPGDYQMTVVADGGEDQRVELNAEFTVEGTPQVLRRLIGRGLVMTSFVSGSVLYDATDLADPEVLTGVLLGELAASASAAQEALPVVTQGRFEGLAGGELFSGSSAEDVNDFLDYVLDSGSRNARFVFVDAYAQWALDGAP